MSGSRAERWRERGAHFSWRPEEPGADAVQVFHLETGAADAAPLLLVHGFPTSSIDWHAVIDRLAERFRVCAVDFPGYGFSSKPRGWGYSLARDASLLDFYLSEIAGVESATVLAHDRGSSVAMILAGGSATRIEHLLLTNGNIFLPLSNLTTAQRLMLDERTAPGVLEQVTPDALAEGLGAAAFFPPRGRDDPTVRALSETFAHEDGVRVLHETIQYLRERSADEDAWLDALAGSELPTTVIWGLNDTVSPPRVASWVWDRKLMLKPGRNALYFVPDAGHYLQDDRPDAVVDAVLHAVDATGEEEPGAIAAAPGAPVLVDRSRERIPSASAVLPVDG